MLPDRRDSEKSDGPGESLRPDRGFGHYSVAMDYPRDYNAAVEFVDRHAQQGRGDKPAFIDPERTLTYGALRDDCARMGRLLREYRLEAESRVAMLVLYTVDFPVIFLGCIRAGVVPVALNTLLTTDQYEYILGDCCARAVHRGAPAWDGRADTRQAGLPRACLRRRRRGGWPP